MSSARTDSYISVEEYLKMEEKAPEKHEYYQGEVFAMAGAGITHKRIVRNTLTSIDSFLKNKNCQIYPSDLKVFVEANSLFTYPDLFVICGNPEFWNDRDDIVLNPSVIIEVLSKSTHNYDRIEKFSLYRDIPPFKEYILIHSKVMRLEQYVKQSPTEWKLKDYKLPEEMINIDTISFSIPLYELYRDVDFSQ